MISQESIQRVYLDNLLFEVGGKTGIDRIDVSADNPFVNITCHTKDGDVTVFQVSPTRVVVQRGNTKAADALAEAAAEETSHDQID